MFTEHKTAIGTPSRLRTLWCILRFTWEAVCKRRKADVLCMHLGRLTVKSADALGQNVEMEGVSIGTGSRHATVQLLRSTLKDFEADMAPKILAIGGMNDVPPEVREAMRALFGDNIKFPDDKPETKH